MNRQQRRAAQKRNGSVQPAPDAAFAAALRHQQAGRLNEARRGYRQILAAHPRHADALHMLGMVEHQSGRVDTAIELITQAAALNGGSGPLHFNLARALEDGGRLDAAAEAYRKAAALWPENADAHANLGTLLQQLGRLDEAAASLRQAIALEPGFAEALSNLGNVLRELGQLEEAETCGRRAVALAPGFAGAKCNLGVTLAARGQGAEAIASYRAALVQQPDLALAHHNLAQALLAQGDFAEGWAEYEWRWQTPRMRGAQRRFTQPQWQGEEAPDKTLLIHAEQGFGDTLQFCRFVPLAAARGLRVVLEVQPPLIRLLQTLPGVAQVIAAGEALPRFDLHIPLLSLPLVLATRLETIPPPAPLAADAALTAHWQSRLPPGRRIGLAWAGAPALIADRQRSIPPALLAPLLAVPAQNFISLQKDSAKAALPLFDAMEEMEDFAATAALIAALDLVITVDTAIAHLAASLGKPVSLLNRYDGCWRWMTARPDSPWYPTVTIFRQPRPGDWATVLAEVSARLAGGRD